MKQREDSIADAVVVKLEPALRKLVEERDALKAEVEALKDKYEWRRLAEGVCTGDIVTDSDGNKVIVVGFLTTHPDSDEVKLVWVGDGLQKDDGPWPPGGRLTAENIGLETRSAREKYRSQVLRALL